MSNKNQLPVTLALIFPAITACALLTAIPTSDQNPILLGMSRSHLLVAGILVLITFLFALIAGWAWLNTGNVQNHLAYYFGAWRKYMIAFGGFSLVASSAWLAIPETYLGRMAEVATRIQPLVVWVLLLGVEILFGAIFWQVRSHKKIFHPQRDFILALVINLAVIAALWMIIATTGLGVLPDNRFWSKPGVPVLWPQIILAFTLGIGLFIGFSRSSAFHFESRWPELLLIGTIWLAAVFLWSSQPYLQGTFDTAPRSPSYEVYPINDSLVFDSAAQRLLVGQNGLTSAVDKPVYITFLAALHFFAGKSYSLFFLFQIFVFALIPVSAYLIGKSLHSPPLGLILAIELVMKERNAIALTNYIQVSTSKMILSEQLTTLGILLFTLLFVTWLKSSGRNFLYLALSGGVLGLASLSRLNSASILVTAILLIGLAVKFKFRNWLAANSILLVFFFISLAPWMGRSLIISGDPLAFIRAKTEGVIVSQRYNPSVPGNTPAPATEPASLPRYFKLTRSMASNYLHNLVGITIMLPPSFQLFKLMDLVRLPYWKSGWDGSLLPDSALVLVIILCVTSIGLAASWSRFRSAGLAPLAVILGYNITNGISLTSGGRYLVPIDWGVLLYFSLGLFEILVWLLGIFDLYPIQIRQSASRADLSLIKPVQSFVIAGLAFLILGSVPLFFENFIPRSYPPVIGINDFLMANQAIPEFMSSDVQSNLKTISTQPGAVISTGRVLYPRYYPQNKGEGPTLAQDPLVGSADFDHLSFLLIGGNSSLPVVLPISGNIPSQLIYSDAWIVGCQADNHVEANYAIFRSNGKPIFTWVNPSGKTCSE